jgi:recombinational DNA repair ATPase RecF
MDTVALFKAKQELNRFLEENPRAKDMQKAIDVSLAKCGNNVTNRIAVLNAMMATSLSELHRTLREGVTAFRRL